MNKEYDIVIEKDIPIPDACELSRKYPFQKMNIGDSFTIEATQENINKLRSSVATAAYSWAKRKGDDRKFSTRVNGNEIGVWRVA
ncbi:hypothetical protein ES705_21968 [subsurface metagenome]